MRVERLAELSRRQLDDPRTPAEIEAGAQELARRWKRKPRWTKPVAIALCGAAAAAAAMTWYALRPLSDPPLTFQSDGIADVSGYVKTSNEGRDRHVHFSDGTHVRFSPGTAARIDASSPQGANIALERGSIHCEVAHRPSARWLVTAGPYRVQVHGTTFDVRWGADDESLEVELATGEVVVVGPSIERGVALQPGQRLSAKAREKEVQIQRTDVVPPPPSATAEHSASAAPTPPPVSASVVVSPPARVSWQKMVAAGRASDVLKEAEQEGIDQVLASRSASDLWALADAARYERRADIARRAYQQITTRFPSTPQARDSTFFLARLEEGSSPRHAADLYHQYRSQNPQGAFAQEALGREMVIVAKSDPARGRRLAKEYLDVAPSGPFAKAARAIGGQP